MAFNTFSAYYGLVKALALKTIKLRYKNSILGFFWSLLNPLLYLIIFSVIFSQAFPGVDRYPLYALSGLILWNYFSTTTIQVTESLIGNAGVIKSIHTPIMAFPLGAQFASLMSFGLSLIPFIGLMFLFGLKVTVQSIMVVPIVVLFTGFTFGFSLIISAMNVYFRDVQLAWNSFMPAIFYATPIAYTSNLIPEKLKWVVQINPLYHFVEAIRAPLYHNTWPSLNNVLLLTAISLLVLGIGIRVFRSLEKGFVSQF